MHLKEELSEIRILVRDLDEYLMQLEVVLNLEKNIKWGNDDLFTYEGYRVNASSDLEEIKMEIEEKITSLTTKLTNL